jgi:cell division protein FtsL
MYQDNNQSPDKEKKWREPNRLQNDIKSLRETVIKQQAEIDDLKSTVRKLQNEVRTAVNAFNLRNHG